MELGETMKLLLRNKAFLLGLTIILALTIVAVFAPWIAPYNPYSFVGGDFEPPSHKHLLGTDSLGRDVFSMAVYGAQVSLFIGVFASLISTFMGAAIGIVSGVYKGWLDTVLMRLADFFLALPSIVIAIILAAVLKPSLYNVIIVIAIVSWPGPARIIRAQALSVMESLYVEAARSLGADKRYIAIKHVFPMSVPLMLANLVLGVRGAILLEAGLSFLGLGDPSHVSWGTILFYAQRDAAFTAGAWWDVIPPGLLIMLAVLGFTMLSLGMDEVINPRKRGM